MGIRCLTKFINQYFKGWEMGPVKGKLIVDGYALFHGLFGSYQQSQIYGGDYVSITRKMKRFFQTLVEAGITPLVVLDGTIDFAKANTVADRAERRIETIVDLLGMGDGEALPVVAGEESGGTIPQPASQTTINPQHITPYLSTDAIIDSIKRVLGEDHLFVSDSDADVDIACLAIHHQCPVLSNDSDFYIFPLLYGYIPYSRFHWRNAKSNGVYGEIYSYQLFCEQFGIHDPSLLTIIPVIVGNDTITPLDREDLKMIMPRDVYTGKLIENAVKYVSSFATFDTCLTSLRNHKLFDMIRNIQHAFYDYAVLPLFKPRTSSVTLVKCEDGSPLPHFILKKYRKGILSPFVIDTLWIHAVCFNVAVEDMLSESWCCLIGVPIRKAIYGILCGSGVCILEAQRCKCATSYEEVEIQSIAHITYDGNQIPLPTLQSCGSEVETEYGKKILFGILDATFEDFKSIPKDYQLLLAITHYWYKHCTINNKDILLRSFLLLVQLLMENKLQKSLSARTPAKHTQPLFPIPSFVHAFAQWQALYRDIKCLNQLLQEPLILLPVSDFLECSYLYSLVEVVFKKGIAKAVDQHFLNRKTHLEIFTAAKELSVQPERK